MFQLRGETFTLPASDNSSEGLQVYRAANERFRETVWPEPFNKTTHKLALGDARNLSSLADESIHLVVTSPPYWTLKEYVGSRGQLGDIADYEEFLTELDKVWRECARVLVPGGRICCVVGDVCVPRKRYGKHFVVPLHADIQVRARSLDLDVLTPVLWHKIANGVTEAEGNGAGFYGKPYQPNAVVKNDIEYILFMRKGGDYRKIGRLQKALSMLTKEEMQSWWRSIWTDVRGASTRTGHPAPYPPKLAERLIRMFSFAGDTVLDPFAGTGSTAIGAIEAGRNSVSLDIEPAYIELASQNIERATLVERNIGAVNANLIVDNTKRGGTKIELPVTHQVQGAV
ncbi:site-specific DNA-methyltransferase [Mesorhizobium sp. B2-3-5]|nr:site-specific DNA-methyltransferase [Mesorhizobium sp. B2-3-5]